MAQQKADEYARETDTDLAVLWDEARMEYEATLASSKVKIKDKKVYRTFEDIMQDPDIQTQFEEVRCMS
jgi:hypothetical protein